MRYKAVQVPRGLVERVKKLILENPELGYVSVRAFVEDAVRHHVERVSKRAHSVLERGSSDVESRED